jgi:N-acetyl-gamma-glutamyl-phosphate reductase
MIKVGIIGSSGYVAGELIRLLVNHPKVDLSFLFSHSNAGEKVSTIHQDLFHYDDLHFVDQIDENIDVVFLCLGHGNSKKFLSQNQFSDQTKIIDLSNDFRLQKKANFQNKNFHYGLLDTRHPALDTKYIANPGCFATAIQLALLPLANAALLKDDIHINGITGSTGAGRSLSNTSHFSWRDSNISLYKEFNHQHLDEVEETVKRIQPSYNGSFYFLPMRGNFTRGILVSAYTKTDCSESALIKCYQEYFQDSEFVNITDKSVNLKQVVNTNNCRLQVQKLKGNVLITAVLDNLLKGAAGQAVQNMNLLFGIEEDTGLNLKSNYF